MSVHYWSRLLLNIQGEGEIPVISFEEGGAELKEKLRLV
jgi:hypothetical protein